MHTIDFSAVERFSVAAEALNTSSRELQERLKSYERVTTGADIRGYADSVKLEKWVEQWSELEQQCLFCWWLELAKYENGFMVMASFEDVLKGERMEVRYENIACIEGLIVALSDAVDWINARMRGPIK